MSQDLGQRLLQHMVEREGTVDPARQHYFIVNARKGFFDPYRQKGEERTHTPWHLDTNHHLGYLPLTLAGIAGNKNFQAVLEQLAKDAFKSLRERPRNFQPEHVHVLFFLQPWLPQKRRILPTDGNRSLRVEVGATRLKYLQMSIL